MRFYIAASSSEEGIERMRALRDRLVAAGHEITYDWTIDLQTNTASGKPDDALDLKERRRYAELDADGIEAADRVIYLQCEKRTEGGAWECAWAYAHGAFLIVVAPNAIPRCLFMARYQNAIVATDDEAYTLAVREDLRRV